MKFIDIRRPATGLLAGAASLALVAGVGLAQTGTGQTGTATGQTGVPEAQGVMLGEQEIRSMLQEAGYSEVEEIQQDGREWTAKASSDGEAVDLRIERITDVAAPGRALDEGEVTSMIEAEGFTGIGDLEQDGETWTADAERDGESVKVHVKADRAVLITERTSG